MTALGLAVAIPAVLAYNAFIRRNRIWMARLDTFAHDLFTIVTVGNKSGDSTAKTAAEQNHNPQFTPTATTTSAFEGRQ